MLGKACDAERYMVEKTSQEGFSMTSLPGLAISVIESYLRYSIVHMSRIYATEQISSRNTSVIATCCPPRI